MLKEAPPEAAEPRPTDDTAQLFSQDQLEAYAARLALTHRLTDNPRRGRPLLPRLDESADRLDAAYTFLSSVGRGDVQPVASEQWLRDNHHVVQDQVREIRQDLPRRYYQQLPKLSDGPFQGYPRIYLLARELIVHTAGRIDLETVVDFAIAYQQTSPLSIGETWAVPIMLRLALIEELRRLADGVVAARESRETARKWHEAQADAEWTPRRIRKLLDDGRLEDGRLPAAFVVELLQWLRDQPSTAAPAWQALQRALQEQGDSADEMLRLEHQHQAADQLAISNAISSMPLLVMRAYPGTLLDETYRAVIHRQIQYGAQRGVPWGISESAYNAQDLELNYQYRAFGVPGLGLKRGLSEDLVVAPYATMLAAPIASIDVVRNLERLSREGAAGRYGYFESIDYTPDRQPLGKHGVVLPTYMAHHQGMTPSPGYIQGYLPGVRENGGQYTHAALWNVLAFAKLGDGDRAFELFSMLNPVNHTRTSDEVQRYRAEPYVVAADVYSAPQHTGRGGWTWYTGSAGWMYRIGIEALLGISLRKGALHIDPCIPKGWPRYEVTFKSSHTPYHIVVENPEGVSRGVRLIEVDGKDCSGEDIPLSDDGVEHSVRVVLGPVVRDP